MTESNSRVIITKARVSNVMTASAISMALYTFVIGGITEVREAPNGWVDSPYLDSNQRKLYD